MKKKIKNVIKKIGRFDIGESVYFIRKSSLKNNNDILDDGVVVGLSYRKYNDAYYLEDVEIEYIEYGSHRYDFIDANYVFKTKQDAYIYLIENAKFVVEENSK